MWPLPNKSKIGKKATVKIGMLNRDNARPPLAPPTQTNRGPETIRVQLPPLNEDGSVPKPAPLMSPPVAPIVQVGLDGKPIFVSPHSPAPPVVDQGVPTDELKPLPPVSSPPVVVSPPVDVLDRIDMDALVEKVTSRLERRQKPSEKSEKTCIVKQPMSAEKKDQIIRLVLASIAMLTTLVLLIVVANIKI